MAAMKLMIAEIAPIIRPNGTGDIDLIVFSSMKPPPESAWYLYGVVI
jgi:hypothetical protein